MIEGRICTQCKQFKAAEFFSTRNGRNNPLVSRCHECRHANYKENPERNRQRAKEHYWANRDKALSANRANREKKLPLTLWQGARRRAREKGLPFDIEVVDVLIPEVCPVLGIPLAMAAGKVAPNSPTLDRIVPERGYVKGNVLVISFRANTIKQDATPEELLRVARFFAPLYGVSSHAWSALAVAVTATAQRAI
jgi:hypothetical protein